LDHPNIASHFETYADDQSVSIVMEYVDGVHLFDKIAADGVKLTESMIASLMKKLFSALHHMH